MQLSAESQDPKVKRKFNEEAASEVFPEKFSVSQLRVYFKIKIVSSEVLKVWPRELFDNSWCITRYGGKCAIEVKISETKAVVLWLLKVRW